MQRWNKIFFLIKLMISCSDFKWQSSIRKNRKVVFIPYWHSIILCKRGKQIFLNQNKLPLHTFLRNKRKQNVDLKVRLKTVRVLQYRYSFWFDSHNENTTAKLVITSSVTWKLVFKSNIISERLIYEAPQRLGFKKT